MEPDFFKHVGRSELVEKLGVKLQCLTTGKGQLTGFQIIGNIEKRRVREIGILLFQIGNFSLVK